MSPQLADIDALRQAWPKVDGKWLCCWCGAERKQFWALCKSCWTHLPADDRRFLLDLDLPNRARWLLDNKPESKPAPIPKPAQETLL